MKNIVFFEKLSKSQISRCILGMASVIMLIVGIINGGFNLLLISMTLLLCHNIVYAFEDIRERLLFLIIHITIFTFLISRPLIGESHGGLLLVKQPRMYMRPFILFGFLCRCYG